MSEQQEAELNSELSQLVSPDERMLLEYEIRFWRQKAWRAEQQRDRAEAARKEAEDIAEKYKSIPQEILDRVVLDLKEKELVLMKEAASVHLPSIGLTNFRRLSSQADMLENIDDKIKHWRKIIHNHAEYKMEDEEEEEEEDEHSE
jgi:hypothetical protein